MIRLPLNLVMICELILPSGFQFLSSKIAMAALLHSYVNKTSVYSIRDRPIPINCGRVWFNFFKFFN